MSIEAIQILIDGLKELKGADTVEADLINRLVQVAEAEKQEPLVLPPGFTFTPTHRKPLTDERCTWRQHDDTNMPDTWEADCGAMWTFTEGGPKANDMKFCPNCGKPTIEAAHGIKE